MIDEYKSYADIAQQISAVRAPLDGVIEVMVQDLVEYYVSQTADNKGKNLADQIKGYSFKDSLAYRYTSL